MKTVNIIDSRVFCIFAFQMKIDTKKLILVVALCLLIAIAAVWYFNYQKQSELELSVAKLNYRQDITDSKVQTELVVRTKNSFESAIELSEHIKKIIESGAYKDFTTGHIKQKERAIQTLFKTADFNSLFQLLPEVNSGRGPVDFVLCNGNDKTQIEVKLATNSKLKHLKAQLEVYSSANGINNTVVPIIYFTQKQRVKAEGIVSQITFTNTTKIIWIDADPLTKPSGSNAKC